MLVSNLKPRYSAQYRSFKLATSTFMLSIIDAHLYSHISQVLRFYYILCSFKEREPVASYAMLMRPENDRGEKRPKQLSMAASI